MDPCLVARRANERPYTSLDLLMPASSWAWLFCFSFFQILRSYCAAVFRTAGPGDFKHVRGMFQILAGEGLYLPGDRMDWAQGSDR